MNTLKIIAQTKECSIYFLFLLDWWACLKPLRATLVKWCLLYRILTGIFGRSLMGPHFGGVEGDGKVTAHNQNFWCCDFTLKTWFHLGNFSYLCLDLILQFSCNIRYKAMRLIRKMVKSFSELFLLFNLQDFWH